MATPALSADDIWRMFAETDRKIQESDRQLKARIEETGRELKARFEETDRMLKARSDETDRLLKARSDETDYKIRELSRNLGDIGNRLGDFVEHMIEPTVVRLFQKQGIEVHEVHSCVHAKRNGEAIEIDLLVVNDGAVVAVECKSKLAKEHVEQHVQRMEKLKRMLPAYRHHQAFGALAGLVVPDHVEQYAQQQGFFVLAQSGETVEVRNDADFTAKAW